MSQWPTQTLSYYTVLAKVELVATTLLCRAKRHIIIKDLVSRVTGFISVVFWILER